MYLDDIFSLLDSSSLIDPGFTDSEHLINVDSSESFVIDQTSDSQPELISSIFAESGDISNLALDSTLTESSFDFGDDLWQPSQFDGLGTPLDDANFWHYQEGSSSCAVVAQIGVYESITGKEISESEACTIAQENGWFDPEIGTLPNDVGKLLNCLGVSTNSCYDASLENLSVALAQGEKVLVALDAHEIWSPQVDPETGFPIEQTDAGHTVWVTGIDQASDGSVKLILNDSGTQSGQMKVVDAVDFLNAWNDYSNFMVVANASDHADSVVG